MTSVDSAYDGERVALLDNACQRLAIRYEEAQPRSPERTLFARWVGVLQREMDRYIATHTGARA